MEQRIKISKASREVDANGLAGLRISGDILSKIEDGQLKSKIEGDFVIDAKSVAYLLAAFGEGCVINKSYKIWRFEDTLHFLPANADITALDQIKVELNEVIEVYEERGERRDKAIKEFEEETARTRKLNLTNKIAAAITIGLASFWIIKSVIALCN